MMKKRWALLVLFFAGLCAVISAQTIRTGDVLGKTDDGFILVHADGTWERIPDDRLLEITERLYPSLATGSDAPSQPPNTSTKSWLVSSKKDPLDDSVSVSIMRLASSGTYSEYDTPSLNIRASASEPISLFVFWDDFLGIADKVPVTWRIDSTQAKTETWNGSTTHNATFYPGDAAALLKSLLSGSRLIVRATKYDRTTITAEFLLDGLSSTLLEVPQLRHLVTR